MAWSKSIRDLVVFVSVYLILSLPPFLVLNQDIMGKVNIEIQTIAIIGTIILVVLSMLFVNSEGVDRFTNFLYSPTNLTSIFVNTAFVIGGISWWLVPEIIQKTNVTLELGTVLAVIIVCHIPLILVLALLTVIGKSRNYPS